MNKTKWAKLGTIIQTILIMTTIIILLTKLFTLTPYPQYNLADIPALNIFAIAIIVFVLIKAMRKNSRIESGLSLRQIGKGLKSKSTWVLLFLPALSAAIFFFVGKYFVPGWAEHVLGRVSLDLTNLPSVAVTLIVMALIEEIMYRAFFQQGITRRIGVFPAIVLTSVIFAIGHVSAGIFAIVAFDVLGVFIDSVIFGTIFAKTKSVWLSFFAHLLGNTAALILMLFAR